MDINTRNRFIYITTFIPFVMPTYAAAQSCSDVGNDTFGKLVNNVISPSQTQQIISLFLALFFIAGIVYMATGLKGLMDASDGRSGEKFSSPMFKIGAGTALVAFPAILYMLTRTVFNSGSGLATNYSNLCGEVDGTTAANNMQQMFMNFVNDAADPLTQAAFVFSILIGLYLVGTSLMRFAQSGQPNSQYASKNGQTIGRLIVGVLFINLPTLLDTISRTVFGSTGGSISLSALASSGSILQYRDNGAGSGSVLETACGVESFIYLGVVPFGIFAFISGLRQVYLSLDGQGAQQPAGKGIVKMVAGILLVNLEMFATAAINTLSPSAAYASSVCG